MTFQEQLAGLLRNLPSVPGILGLREFFRVRSLSYNEPTRWTVMNNYDGDLRLMVCPTTVSGSALYWHGYSEPAGLNLMRRFLTKEMVVADIGANIGEFTIFAAKRAAKVLAFEPMPAMYDILTQSVRLNGFHHVEVFPLALSKEPGKMQIYTAADHSRYGAHNYGVFTLFPTEHRSTPVTEVEVGVFDDVFERTGLKRLDFVKIDTEGAEPLVLMGARKALSTLKPMVFVEIHDLQLAAAGFKAADVLTFFEELGYKPFAVALNGSLSPAPVQQLPVVINLAFKV